MITEIKRDDSATGLDDLFGYSADDVENHGTINVVRNANMDYALEELEKYLSFDFMEKRNYKHNITLSPDEINSFFQMTAIFKDLENYLCVSSFVNELIQNSYDAGNNNFYLNVENFEGKYLDDKNLDGFPYLGQVNGEFNRPLCLNVKGDVCHYAKNVINFVSNVNGNVGFFSCMNAKRADIAVKGDVGSYFGSGSHHSKFLVGGSAKDNFVSNSFFATIFLSGSYDERFCYSAKHHDVFLKLGNSATIHGKKYALMGSEVKDHPQYKMLSEELSRRVLQ
jgi:hypothetical protein